MAVDALLLFFSERVRTHRTFTSTFSTKGSGWSWYSASISMGKCLLQKYGQGMNFRGKQFWWKIRAKGIAAKEVLWVGNNKVWNDEK